MHAILERRCRNARWWGTGMLLIAGCAKPQVSLRAPATQPIEASRPANVVVDRGMALGAGATGNAEFPRPEALTLDAYPMPQERAPQFLGNSRALEVFKKTGTVTLKEQIFRPRREDLIDERR